MTQGFTLDRRRLMATALGATGALALPRLVRAQGGLAGFPVIREPFVVVETASGRIRGGHEDGALAFKGVPYAGSPAGMHRFKAAPPLESWTGVRDCLQLGPPTIQPPNGTYGGPQEPAPSEDCLVLNVWTPAVGDGRKRPVMLWNHGGGYVSGSGGSPDADGAHLARDYDVVVVATNHRLGILGFLYLGEIGGEEYATSGNQGMLDIVAALNWVKTNIEAFGGDPNNVLIWGESGGGAKTCTLCAMPSAKDLFHKVGVISGPELKVNPREGATALAEAILAKLEIGPHELHKLADVPIPLLLDAQQHVHLHPRGPGFGVGAPRIDLSPVLDGTYVSQNPFDPAPAPWMADKPLIIGMNREEARFFAMAAGDTGVFSFDEAAMEARVRHDYGDAFADQVLPAFRKDRPDATPTDIFVAAADAAWWIQSITLAERKAAQNGAPAFMYRYDYESNHKIPGTDQVLRAGHATEIAAEFEQPDAPGLMGDRPDRYQIAKIVSAFWTSFARTGQPACVGQPAWPAYVPPQRATMSLNLSCQVIDDPYAAERRALLAVGGEV